MTMKAKVSAKRAKVSASGSVRVKVYNVVAEAVQVAVSSGVHRAHKYADLPTPATIEAEVYHAVMLALCEVFDFETAGEP